MNGFTGCTVDDRVLALPMNLMLPATVVTNQLALHTSQQNQVGLVLAHGLGFGNPQSKSHAKENWLPIVASAALQLQSAPVTAVFYTARGHGTSTGWESDAQTCPESFSWNNLSHDMANVASSTALEKFIACGSSMGAATALFCAINYPDRVSGLIMIRPPTGWDERKARRGDILRSAKDLEELNHRKNKQSVHHLVLVGAATADLPPLEDVECYKKIKCPVLILAVKGDEAHPEKSARCIAERLSKVELVFAEDYAEASSTWPTIVKDFMERIIGMDRVI